MASIESLELSPDIPEPRRSAVERAINDFVSGIDWREGISQEEIEEYRKRRTEEVSLALGYWERIFAIPTSRQLDILNYMIDKGGNFNPDHTMRMIKGLPDDEMNMEDKFFEMSKLVTQTNINGSGSSGVHSTEISRLNWGFRFLAAAEHILAQERKQA